MTWLSGLPVGAWAPSGLLALVVMLVLSGLLVPRRNLRDSQRETDQWRAAFIAEVQAHAVTREQLGEMLIQGQVTNAILGSASGGKRSRAGT